MFSGWKTVEKHLSVSHRKVIRRLPTMDGANVPLTMQAPIRKTENLRTLVLASVLPLVGRKSSITVSVGRREGEQKDHKYAYGTNHLPYPLLWSISTSRIAGTSFVTS